MNYQEVEVPQKNRLARLDYNELANALEKARQNGNGVLVPFDGGPERLQYSRLHQSLRARGVPARINKTEKGFVVSTR